MKSLSVRYYWHKMRAMVKRVVEDCEFCARFNRAQTRDPPVEPDIDVEELDPMFYYQSKY